MLLSIITVFAFSMQQSVKEAAKTYYFDLDTPTGVYNSVFDKLSQDNRVCLFLDCSLINPLPDDKI